MGSFFLYAVVLISRSINGAFFLVDSILHSYCYPTKKEIAIFTNLSVSGTMPRVLRDEV